MLRRRPKAIRVSSHASFESVVRRVRKELDAGRTSRAFSSSSPGAGRIVAAQQDEGDGRCDVGEVLVQGTGRAIEKTLRVAAFFDRQPDCRISLRTRTVGTIDDIVLDEDDAQAREQSRVRMVSCLEVGVRLR